MSDIKRLGKIIQAMESYHQYLGFCPTKIISCLVAANIEEYISDLKALLPPHNTNTPNTK